MGPSLVELERQWRYREVLGGDGADGARAVWRGSAEASPDL
jgi:hypothetical protein